MRCSKILPVPIGLKIKMWILKTLHKVPSTTRQPFCDNPGHRGDLSINDMILTGCLEGEGRFFRRPCRRLKWYPIFPRLRWQIKEWKLLEIMGWRPFRWMKEHDVYSKQEGCEKRASSRTEGYQEVYARPVSLRLKMKMAVLQLFRKAPSIPHLPYCGKHHCNLPYGSLLLTRCFDKRGRIFKMPCRYLWWFPQYFNWPPVELKILEIMGWKPSTFTTAERMRAYGFIGEMPCEYEEKPSP